MLSLVEAESDASANEIRDAILDGTTCKPTELTWKIPVRQKSCYLDWERRFPIQSDEY